MGADFESGKSSRVGESNSPVGPAHPLIPSGAIFSCSSGRDESVFSDPHRCDLTEVEVGEPDTLKGAFLNGVCRLPVRIA